MSSAGGHAVTGADGSLALAAEVPREAELVEVTAVVDATPSVHALLVHDDGNGAALCAGGAFDLSPASDSFLAKWGCARRVRRTSW